MRIRCPHCQQRIEIVDDSTFKDIACPSCGSSFSLVGEITESYAQKENTVAHFQFVERLGAGQFGAVWKARDTELDRIVAIKRMLLVQIQTDEPPSPRKLNSNVRVRYADRFVSLFGFGYFIATRCGTWFATLKGNPRSAQRTLYSRYVAGESPLP